MRTRSCGVPPSSLSCSRTSITWKPSSRGSQRLRFQPVSSQLRRGCYEENTCHGCDCCDRCWVRQCGGERVSERGTLLHRGSRHFGKQDQGRDGRIEEAP